jgi:hypothetical protein
MKKEHFVELISCCLILLFVYTGITKLFDHSGLKRILETIPFIENPIIASFVVIALPIAELVVAGILIIPQFRKTGMYLSLSLMLFFTIYISLMLAFSIKLPCICGGVLKSMTWIQHLFFNIFFLCLSLLGVVFSKQIASKTEVSRTKAK